MVLKTVCGMRVGMALSILGGALVGCGVVYTPQEFEKSAFTYGYKGDFDVAIEVIPLTFTTARLANLDGYVPRTLPSAFADTEPDSGAGPSPRDRFSAAGVYDVEPPLVLELPSGPASYDGNGQILPPVMRSEDLQPLAYPDPTYLPLPAQPYSEIQPPQTGGVLAPISTMPSTSPYVSGSDAVPYAVDGQSLPVLQVQGASSASGPVGGRMGRQTPPSSSDIDLSVLLERPQVRREIVTRPLPYVEPGLYRIGPGDVIGVQVRSIGGESGAGALSPVLQQFQVQDTGEIFIAQIGGISVNGLTLSEARRIINDRLVASGLGFDPGVQIVEFGSKSISVSGLSSSRQIPISVRPITLSQALVSAGGLGSTPEDTIVRVQRGDEIYEMNGDDILASDAISERILIDGDLVIVTTAYDPRSAIAYFNQQRQLREISRNEFTDTLAAAQDRRSQEQLSLERQRFQTQEQRAEEQLSFERQRFQTQEQRTQEQLSFERQRFEMQERRADAAENRARGQDSRAADAALLDRTRLDLDLRRSRLETARLRRETEIAQLQSQRETDRFNEEARIANIEARQAYLDRLRALEVLNRDALRQIRQETRETLIANQAERVRARAERLGILERELQQEQARLDRSLGQRQQARTLFREKLDLGAIDQDYITVAGETRNQLTMPLPFDGKLTLNRVLYEKTNGIDPLYGDTSEIYVIRTPEQDRIQDKVIAYHLDASNPASLAVASLFEMRPNDVVYVNPQPITKWNRVLTQILPSTGLLQSGITAGSGL